MSGSGASFQAGLPLFLPVIILLLFGFHRGSWVYLPVNLAPVVYHYLYMHCLLFKQRLSQRGSTYFDVAERAAI